MTLSTEAFRVKYNYQQTTPILQQYLDIKCQNQDCIIFFRLGDFYELFYEDAIKVSKILSLTLTKRSNKDQSVPMCGLPHHAANTYLPKLVEEGYKIAICEQLETPEEAKKRAGSKAVVNREVVRIITQGTIFEEDLLEQQTPNYLVSIILSCQQAALAYLDISTLDFSTTKLHIDSLVSEIARINPKEIIISQNTDQSLRNILKSYEAKLTFQVESYFAEQKCRRSIENFYKINNLQSIGELSGLEISAIGSILQYVELTQKSNLPKLPFPKILSNNKLLLIDSTARKGLEILCNNNGKTKGSTFDAINSTNTKCGARLMYKMLASPLTDIEQIRFRHELIDFFAKHQHISLEIIKHLKKLTDPERTLSRITMNRANPKDLINLKDTIEIANQIKTQIIKEFGLLIPQEIDQIVNDLKAHDVIFNLIEQTIQLDCFGNFSEFGYIKNSYHPKVSELSNLMENTNAVISTLRARYAQETGIDSLKITQNNLLGMFIEISSKQAAKVSHPTFIHKQTTLNTVRFTTIELQDLESKIVNAKESLISLEREIFADVCEKVGQEALTLLQMVHALSLLDVASSFSQLAIERNYTKPQMTQGLDFFIQEGRHPCVELALKAEQKPFIANDCDLSDGQSWIITGPNMGGKSTFLRQNAIITIMAQSGFFIPAKFAIIGIIDKIFTRIGASDDLASGQSTFMVEMSQTSSILAQATSRSLIILDEIGRGTATYDGLSIAWSALEYIASKFSARCLFASHYHELTKLDDMFDNIKNYHVSTKEIEQKLLFLHKIQQGAADKSYGINVAQLAGMPKEIIHRAKQILAELERNKNTDALYSRAILDAADDEYKHLYEKIDNCLTKIDLDNTTPKQALEYIYKLKNLLL